MTNEAQTTDIVFCLLNELGIPMAGATIGLYADAKCNTLIKTGVSGQDGTIAFDGLMEDQTYWLKEISAPSGYQLKFTIYEGTEVKPNVTIDNEPITTPDNLETPDDPGTPDNPATFGNQGEGGLNGKPSIPQTGDDTPWLAKIVFILGILSVVMP